MKIITKIILFLLSISFVTFAALYAYRYIWAYNFNRPSQFNSNTVEKIKSLGKYYDPIMSWNTKKYGRIYASICSPATTMYPCSMCYDGGVDFFNSRGKYIGNCNGMSGSFPALDILKDSIIDCNYLNGLTYDQADYISKPCEKNKKDDPLIMPNRFEKMLNN